MFFKYVRIISETRLKCHKTELTMMHTFLNRKLTIFVCLAFGGLATGRAQVQPLPIIPPNALVQTYTGRLAYTLLNGYVKNDDARLSDSRTPTGTAGGDLSGTYPNPTIKASVNLSGNPTATTQDLSDNSARIATTAFVHNVRKARKLYGVNLSGVTGMWTDEGQVFYSSAPNFTVQLDSGLPIIAKTRVANSCHIVTEANTTTISVTLKFPNGNSTSKTITGLNASKHYLLHILCIKWSSGDPGATISIMEII